MDSGKRCSKNKSTTSESEISPYNLSEKLLHCFPFSFSLDDTTHTSSLTG